MALEVAETQPLSELTALQSVRQILLVGEYQNFCVA